MYHNQIKQQPKTNTINASKFDVVKKTNDTVKDRVPTGMTKVANWDYVYFIFVPKNITILLTSLNKQDQVLNWTQILKYLILHVLSV